MVNRNKQPVLYSGNSRKIFKFGSDNVFLGYFSLESLIVFFPELTRSPMGIKRIFFFLKIEI